MGHGSRMFDQALHCAEGFREGEHLGGVGHPHRGVAPRAQRERHHPPEVAHLGGGGIVAGVIGQLGVQHAIDGGMTRQQVDDGAGIFAVAFHTDREGLDATEHEVTVERRRDGTGGIFFRGNR